MIPTSPTSALFPYTTLFRSAQLFERTLECRITSPQQIPESSGFRNCNSQWNIRAQRPDHAGGFCVPDANRRAKDRKSTRLNSSHEWISYAVFCLKKKRRETT